MKDNSQKRREQLNKNKLKGKAAEEFVKTILPLEGRIPISSGNKGFDIEAKRVSPVIKNPLTGKIEPDIKLIEVKSGKANTSELQEETRRKNKDIYEVRRPPFFK